MPNDQMGFIVGFIAFYLLFSFWVKCGFARKVSHGFS